MSSEIDKCHLGRWAKSPLVETLCLKYSYFSFSCKVGSDSLWPRGLQQTRLPYPYLPEFAETHVHWVNDAFQPSHPLISPQSFPASGSFPLSWLFTLGGQNIGVSASASVLQDWVVWSPCCPRDCQESSPAPQFQSINSSVLSLLYGPTLMSTWLLENP